uniref:Uncharacterized protein n=1 Tax=Heterorhabditis bacteriophora TaxID=37862 RepID=A0A1I7X4Z1_HETBA
MNVFGARLAAKYLDKELAGRIQQIQLLGRNMRGVEHDRLWNQLEAEIYLHRHKTVIRACRGRGQTKGLLTPPRHDYQTLRKRKGVGKTRKVTLAKAPHEGLGISITQGDLHMEVVFVSPDDDSDDDGTVLIEDTNGSMSSHILLLLLLLIFFHLIWCSRVFNAVLVFIIKTLLSFYVTKSNAKWK